MNWVFLSLMEAVDVVFQEIINSRISSFCHFITQTLALHNWYCLFTGHCPHFIYWFRHLVTTEFGGCSIFFFFILHVYTQHF